LDFEKKKKKHFGVLLTILTEGISTDPDKVKSVQDWPRPKTPMQMRGLSWSLLLLQEMWENFAFIARPLHKL
jgi:hypothetical protein